MEYKLDRSERDGMREMTVAECRIFYLEHSCPFCWTSRQLFIPGPRGGLSVNVGCPKCAGRLNVIDERLAGGPIVEGWGQVIREPRIRVSNARGGPS